MILAAAPCSDTLSFKLSVDKSILSSGSLSSGTRSMVTIPLIGTELVLDAITGG